MKRVGMTITVGRLWLGWHLHSWRLWGIYSDPGSHYHAPQVLIDLGPLRLVWRRA